MGKLGEFFISIGGGVIFLLCLMVGVLMIWKIQCVYPRFSRWLAWLFMGLGIICGSFSLGVGVFIAILGAALLAVCDIREQSP